MFKTNTFEILKWDLIITFVTRGTQVVWLLLLGADRLLFHFGKLEQKWRGRTAWKRQMESGCDDYGKWMNEWMEWPSRCAGERERECEQMLNVDINGRSDQFNRRVARSFSSTISELSRAIRNERWLGHDLCNPIVSFRGEMLFSGASDKYLAIQMDPFAFDFSSWERNLPFHRWTQIRMTDETSEFLNQMSYCFARNRYVTPVAIVAGRSCGK